MKKYIRIILLNMFLKLINSIFFKLNVGLPIYIISRILYVIFCIYLSMYVCKCVTYSFIITFTKKFSYIIALS